MNSPLFIDMTIPELQGKLQHPTICITVFAICITVFAICKTFQIKIKLLFYSSSQTPSKMYGSPCRQCFIKWTKIQAQTFSGKDPLTLGLNQF